VELNGALTAALDRIAERAADVRRAFSPGAVPHRTDVESPASAEFTLDPLSAAAPENAYFLTVDARGRTQYSRDGRFRISNGVLVDARGCTVLGRSPAGGNPSIAADGSVSYRRLGIDPRTGARTSRDVVVGRLALARFPAATRLEGDDGVHCTAPENVTPHTGLAGDGTFEALQPMHRSRSQVDVDEGLARLKAAYVAFDALAAAETARDRLGKTAMDVVK
jgi:flagellar basal body rod protein FlgG